MIQYDSNERLVQELSADLTTVRRLPSPGPRVLIWLAIIGSMALALTTVSDVKGMIIRLMAAPDMWLAALASMFTAVLAATAAFELSLPDRKAARALLPLPALMLWISASGMGCLRVWSVAEASPMPPDQPEHCLIFILGFSLPLSLLLIALLRRGFSLRPNLTAVIGGFACASAAATLLNFVHSYDAAATDLAVHALAVTIVVLANIAFGGRILLGNMNKAGVIRWKQYRGRSMDETHHV
jgi:hypothetical protein